MSPTHDNFAESHLVDDVTGLRQGDIISWLPAKTDVPADPWRCCGVIVTADCDIVQNKYGDVLSYVPLLPAEDYVRLFVLPPLLRKVLNPKIEELKTLVHKLQQAHRPDFTQPLSEKVIESWLQEEGPDAVLEGLGVPEGKQCDTARRVMADVVSAWAAERSGSYSDLFSAVVSLKGGKDTHAETLRKQVRDKLCGLPGDAFFLGQIAGVKKQGFIAYLRLVREVSLSAVAVRTSELERDGIEGRRIARLTAPYIYRLTQQLGDVFSAIGLPRHYEDHRSLLVDAMLNSSNGSSQPDVQGPA